MFVSREGNLQLLYKYSIVSISQITRLPSIIYENHCIINPNLNRFYFFSNTHHYILVFLIIFLNVNHSLSPYWFPRTWGDLMSFQCPAPIDLQQVYLFLYRHSCQYICSCYISKVVSIYVVVIPVQQLVYLHAVVISVQQPLYLQLLYQYSSYQIWSCYIWICISTFFIS